MNNAESRITQNANSIALKVSTSTYNTEKVYRGSSAPTTLYTNMLWLDTSVTPNLLKRYTGGTWVAAGAQEVKSSGIYIGDNNVSITTENFLLQLVSMCQERGKKFWRRSKPLNLQGFRPFPTLFGKSMHFGVLV